MAEKHADPLLVAKNKWLIGYPESGLPDNMVLVVWGESYSLNLHNNFLLTEMHGRNNLCKRLSHCVAAAFLV